jgi:hypothetical protein
MKSKDTPIDSSRVDTVVLDARPLFQIVHPREFEDIMDWFGRGIEAGYRVVIPEVVDYEVRRGLLRVPARKQLTQLDDPGKPSTFLPCRGPS